MEELKKENDELKQKVKELQEHLDKYTKPERNKRFYENHKDEIKQKNYEYRKKLSKEKIKEYKSAKSSITSSTSRANQMDNKI